MQKHEPQGVTLHCDFCGQLWDMHQPMIEGHRGSVLCLDCLEQAIMQISPDSPPTPCDETFSCTLCLREYPADAETRWRHPEPPSDADPKAAICLDCLRQADRAFDRDPDTAWTRKLAATDRWR